MRGNSKYILRKIQGPTPPSIFPSSHVSARSSRFATYVQPMTGNTILQTPSLCLETYCRIHRSCTGVKASFKALKLTLTRTMNSAARLLDSKSVPRLASRLAHKSFRHSSDHASPSSTGQNDDQVHLYNLLVSGFLVGLKYRGRLEIPQISPYVSFLHSVLPVYSCSSVAKFLVPDGGDIVDSGIGLSYRLQRLHGGPVQQHHVKSRLYPQAGTKNLASVLSLCYLMP